MNTKPSTYINFAMSIGTLFGTAFGPAILDNHSAFSLVVFVGAAYGPIIGYTASVY